MKSSVIKIVLSIIKMTSSVSAPLFWNALPQRKKIIAEYGRKKILKAFPKLRPLVYYYFYELVKRIVTSPLIITKEINPSLKMELDVSKKTQRQIYFFPQYEEPIRKYIGKTLRSEDVFIDVGANVGYYTMIASQIVGPKGKVYAFEPEASNFDRLTRHIRINRFSNVYAYHGAVGAKPGRTKLYLNPLNEGGHSFHKHRRFFDSGRSISIEAGVKKFPDFKFEEEVEVVPLSSFVKDKKIQRINLLKIDVEGAQMEVIKGMLEILNKQKVAGIICELNKSDSDLIKMLNEREYRIYRCTNDGDPELLRGDVKPGNYLFL